MSLLSTSCERVTKSFIPTRCRYRSCTLTPGTTPSTVALGDKELVMFMVVMYFVLIWVIGSTVYYYVKGE
jgi:hypothetical protein